MTPVYSTICAGQLTRQLFGGFIRRQTVTDCWRREAGRWVVRSDPFTDDWTEADYQTLLDQLRQTCRADGLVYGAFVGGGLKGFVSVERELFGGAQRYMDLTNLHVSADWRGKGVGTALFLAARAWAGARGAGKLYISAHSAVETQRFYRRLGCVEAQVYSQRHVQAEPYDCQLECPL